MFTWTNGLQQDKRTVKNIGFAVLNTGIHPEFRNPATVNYCNANLHPAVDIDNTSVSFCVCECVFEVWVVMHLRMQSHVALFAEEQVRVFMYLQMLAKKSLCFLAF